MAQFSLANESIELSESILKRKKLYGLGNPVLNFTEFRGVFDFNPTDLGDTIDALSQKDIHPINFSTEQMFDTLIDQKVDEALEYYLLTGVEYSSLFRNYRYIPFNSAVESATID